MIETIQRVAADVGGIVLGKQPQIRLALCCLLARGHLLIEDLPGVGKTTLAQALALALGLRFNRVQFTNDLLPADIVGGSVFDRQGAGFVFHPGPVFAHLLLADEINRASPKSQSALLEAMEERQVTVDGITRALPSPFFVIATQNPQDQVGTFALPESQLDRFLMCLSLGYPDPRAERALLEGQDRRGLLSSLAPRIDAAGLLALQGRVDTVHCAAPLLDYLQALLAHTRASPAFPVGLSPRAGLGLLRAARAAALLDGRDHVLPDDLRAVLPAVAGHRLRPARGRPSGMAAGTALVADLIAAVPLP